MSDLKENMVGDSDSDMALSDAGSSVVQKKPKHLWSDPALPQG